MTYVVDVSDVAGCDFSRLIVAGDYITDFQASSGDHDLEGLIDGDPHVYLTWHDGSQTTADAYLLANYASYPERPWAANMTGEGICYAVITFRYNREIFNSLPGVRLEVKGIPLYDPRKDSTAGGSGSHRWSNRSTWEFTENPVVMVYNILRGIALPGGRTWGGQVAAADLPLSNWFAAMNECDESVNLNGGGSELRYRAGYEVHTADDTPADVIAELLKSCSADIVEIGGVYKVRVGPPAMPVFAFSDDDVLIEQPEMLNPYPGLEEVYNAIHASHPDPQALWETRDAPPRYNSTWEEEDGDRQLVAAVDLPTVASRTQVQRLMRAWIKDERRFRRHGLMLGPSALAVEPLDVVAFTSPRNGYTGKAFEVGEAHSDPLQLTCTLSMRERDDTDFDWTTGDELAVETPSVIYVPPATRTVPGWNVEAVAVEDTNGDNRRPGIKISWTASKTGDATGIEYEVRPDGRTTLVSMGMFSDLTKGWGVITAGILPNENVEVRGRLVMRNRARDWTAWTDVTTLDIKLKTGTDFTILNEDLQNLVDQTSFAQGLTGVEIVNSLPTTGNYPGRVVFLTTDNKLYRRIFAAWTVEVDGGDIKANSILSGAIAAGAVKTEQLDFGAGTGAKLAVGDFQNYLSGSTGNWGNHPWNMGAGTAISTSSPHSPGAALALYNSHDTTTLIPPIDALGGEKYYLDFWAVLTQNLSGATSNTRVRLIWKDDADQWTGVHNIPLNGLVKGTWTRLADTYVAPAGSVSATVHIQSDHNAGTVYLDDMSLRRVTEGVWIADGAVNAAKLHSGELITKTAQIKNALVDTLHIAGQAVTVPVYTKTSSTVDVTSHTAWTTCLLLNMTRAGYATALQFTAQASGLGDTVLEYRFQRDSTVIDSGYHVTIGHTGRQTSVAISTVDTNTGTGGTNYIVRVKKLYGSGNPFGADGRVKQMFLSAHQFKR
ncbi:phage tail protein [Pukyongiella litopenaei]|nr:phage tail protein [Pukyongiella litopenaei]